MYQEFPELIKVFLHLSTFPTCIDEDIVSYIEACGVQFYDKHSDIRSDNSKRFEFFYHKGKDIKLMPPSKDALFQHTLRAAYRAGHIWRRT